MIVKMKKLTLLCTLAQRERALEKLRRMKVVHVEHVHIPEDEELEQARNRLQRARRVRDILAAYPDAKPDGKVPDQLMDAVWKLLHRKRALQEALHTLQDEQARITPFGEFDPGDIEKLRTNGVFTKLYELSGKKSFEVPRVYVHEISRKKNTVYLLAIGREAFSIPAREEPLPDCLLSDIEHCIEKTKKELKEIEAEFEKCAAYKRLVDEKVKSTSDTVNFLEVRHGMGTQGGVVYLRGFCPADRENDITVSAQEYGWGYRLEEAGADEEPPTLLRNPGFVNLINPVFKMIGVLPGYREIDISLPFLIFMSIFFAFLIGDAGYGLLFLGFSLFAKIRLKERKIGKPVLNLIMTMSVATIIWGMLNGIYFGINFAVLPPLLKNLSLPWLIAEGNESISRNRIMFICFSIGAVHLTVAHLMRLFQKIKSPACLCDFGWLLSTWSLYFMVLYFVLDMTKLHLLMGVTLLAGVFLVTTGLILSRAVSGLVTLILDIIGNFVDIISYVRLYAVGAATLAIAQSSNKLGADAGSACPAVFGGLITVLIIFIGHILNILLGAMGVLVHGIRLNTLEFSGHAGVQWGGTEYKPFGKS